MNSNFTLDLYFTYLFSQINKAQYIDVLNVNFL